MTKVDIFSGFLGAGKTTLIKKLIAEAYSGEKLVLIENEFGEIGVDGGFMSDAGIEVTEMNSGCICCSLVGDFARALEMVTEQYAPDRILIEPSGVGKLSDIIRAVADIDGLEICAAVTVADASKCRMYAKNFGEFYDDQIKHAGAIILSRTAGMSADKLEKCLQLLRERNAAATIITTPWDELDGKQILSAMEGTDTLRRELEQLARESSEEHEHHHHHHDHEHEHHHDHDEHDEHEHHHDHDEHEHEHHHDHDEHEHEHHHDHDDHDEHEHHHDHEHHHHHHDGEHDADEIFVSWGEETAKKFTEAEITSILAALGDSEKYGLVLRAKGIVDASDGGWLYFDYVPEETDVRRGGAQVTGRVCVIGSELKEDAIESLFGV